MELTNIELFEFVAKAIGITGYAAEDWSGVYFCTPSNPEEPRSYPVVYHWLDDDGDAFRLAVKLNVMPEIDYEMGWATIVMPTLRGIQEELLDDPLAATRRDRKSVV